MIAAGLARTGGEKRRDVIDLRLLASIRPPCAFLHSFELVQQFHPSDGTFLASLQAVGPVKCCRRRRRGATELEFGALLPDMGEGGGGGGGHVRSRGDVEIAYRADAVQPILQRCERRRLWE